MVSVSSLHTKDFQTMSIAMGVVSMCVHDVLLLLAECSTSYIFQQHGMSHPLDKDY